MSKHSSINRKFDDQINVILDRIASKNDPDQENPTEDRDDMPETSETVRDTLDGDGNVTSSVVEKRYETSSPISTDIQDLKSVVAVKNDYNDHRKALVDTAIKAGLAVVSVVIMLGFEMSHSITTRTLSFMPKPKI